MKKICLALDLENDERLIAEYDRYHERVWPEILESIRLAGIIDMEIYRISNRLFMIMDTSENFSFETKTKNDSGNLKVQEWEQLMWKYQKSLPGTRPGEKWVIMNKIFSLKEQSAKN